MLRVLDLNFLTCGTRQLKIPERTPLLPLQVEGGPVKQRVQAALGWDLRREGFRRDRQGARGVEFPLAGAPAAVREPRTLCMGAAGCS